MPPAIEPGFGIGVAEGARVNVIVALGPTVGVKVGDGASVKVLVGCPMVGEESCSKVGEDSGAGWADWVKTAKVKATCVATAPGLLPTWVADPGKLHAHRQEIMKAETNIINCLFIIKPPLDELIVFLRGTAWESNKPGALGKGIHPTHEIFPFSMRIPII